MHACCSRRLHTQLEVQRVPSPVVQPVSPQECKSAFFDALSSYAANKARSQFGGFGARRVGVATPQHADE